MKTRLLAFLLLAVVVGIGFFALRKRPAARPVIVTLPGARLTLLEKQVELQAWREPPSEPDTTVVAAKDIPQKILPVGYHPVEARVGARFYAVQGERALAGGGVADVGLWLFDKQWKSRGRVQGVPFRGEKELEFGWLNDGQTLGVAVTKKHEPEEEVWFGVVDLARLQMQEIFRVAGLVEAGTIWLEREAVFYCWDTRAAEKRVLGIDFKNRKKRILFREADQYLARQPFSVVAPSPDKTRVAFDRLTPFKSYSSGIWLLDVETGAFRELTVEKQTPYYHAVPTWTKDGHLQFFRRELGSKGYDWNLYQVTLPREMENGKSAVTGR